MGRKAKLTHSASIPETKKALPASFAERAFPCFRSGVPAGSESKFREAAAKRKLVLVGKSDGLGFIVVGAD